jgi:virulence-associated protein VagC
VAAKRSSKRGARKRSQHPAPAASGVIETKVFKTGNSYAVRLPKTLYSGGETPVYIQKLDHGKLLIMPKQKKRWPAGFLESFGNMPTDFEPPARPPASTLDNAKDAALFTDDE